MTTTAMEMLKSSMSPESGGVTEVKNRLAGETSRYPCRWLARSPGEAVVWYQLPRQVDLHGVLLPAGTVSIGYFWQRRPYNVYHFLTGDGVTVALYCNICDRTAIAGDSIHWRDLVVDVLVMPGGQVRVLDEEELPEGLEEKVITYIENARDRLVASAPALLRELEGYSRALWPSLQADSQHPT